jgi:hypothetical protein
LPQEIVPSATRRGYAGDRQLTVFFRFQFFGHTGSNNYRKGAAFVERIGKGGFWMSGTVRRAGDGAPLAGQRI